MTSVIIEYRNCPLSISGQQTDDGRYAERVAVLAPHKDDLMRIIAVTDIRGTYPARGYYDPNSRPAWIYGHQVNECPPGRNDVLMEMIHAWSMSGLVKLARWCRNRAFEHAWNADAANSAASAASDAADAANTARNTAIDAANTARNTAIDAAFAATRCAEAARSAAAFAARSADAADAVYHEQWLLTFEWIAAHDAKYRQVSEA